MLAVLSYHHQKHDKIYRVFESQDIKQLILYGCTDYASMILK